MRIHGEGQQSSRTHFCDFTGRKNQKYGTLQQGHSSDSNLTADLSTSCGRILQFLLHVSNTVQTVESAFGKMGNIECGYSCMLQLNYIFGNTLNRTRIFGQNSAMMT